MNSDEIRSKLLSYQPKHVDSLIKSLVKFKRALDASDTGTGKTFSAIATALLLNLKPFIICPKSVIPTWIECINYFGIEYYGISNYELIKLCRYYPSESLTRDVVGSHERTDCPFVTRTLKPSKPGKLTKSKPTKLGSTQSPPKKPQKTKKEYIFTWKLPDDVLVIFDEAHRCKNKRTMNSDILLTIANNIKHRILLLSATIADKPENFEHAGWILGLYPSLRNAAGWMRRMTEMGNTPMKGVHNYIFPKYAARMRIRDLGDKFPSNQVLAECYQMDDAVELQHQYKLIEEAVKFRQLQEDSTACKLVEILRARQKVEMIKVPTFIEMAKQYIEEGLAVAIFVNFTETLLAIADQLNTNCLIYGQQTLEQRNHNIERFNNDKSHIIVCNIRAGGVGISLHDKHGVYPRISIISPSWSAQDIVQALGRIHRANGKSPVRQRLVYCKDTVEERLCKCIRTKITDIGCLNDGDVLSYKYEGLIDSEELGVDRYRDLSKSEIRFQKLDALTAKRDRLKTEIQEVEEDIRKLGLNN